MSNEIDEECEKILSTLDENDNDVKLNFKEMPQYGNFKIIIIQFFRCF